MRPNKSVVENLFLFAVLATHIVAIFVIWTSASFDTAQERQNLTLIIAPVTAAYFLAGVRFAIRNQRRGQKTDPVNLAYVLTVAIVTLAFLGAILWLVIGYANEWISTPIGDIKVVVGAIETFMGAAFALIAEDIFQEKIEPKPNG